MELELKILGVLLTCEDKEICKYITRECSYKYFGSKSKKIYGIIKQTILKNDMVVFDKVKETIEKHKMEDYFYKIMECEFVDTDYKKYVEEIKATYINKRLDSIKKISNEKEKAVLIKELSEDIGSGSESNVEILDFQKMALDFFSGLDEEDTSSIRTKEWVKFNNMIPMVKQDLIVIAGRPAMGKTAYSLSLALQLTKAGNHGMFFSLEMSPTQLFKRSLSQLSAVNLSKLNKEGIKNLTNTEQDNLELAKNEMDKINKNFKVVSGNFTIDLIRQQIEIVSQFKQLDFIMIDYLQLIKPSTNSSRYEAITEISMELKRIAKQYNITVFALAQLSRATEARTEKEPILSDLKESGAIEQDSSVVIGLYRDYYYSGDLEKKNLLDAIVLKNRDGETGIIRNYCDLSIQQIKE